MTTVFLMADDRLGEANEIEGVLRDAFGERYVITAVAETEALLEHLRGSLQAVVIFQAAPERLQPFIQQCRSALSATACVAIPDVQHPADAETPILQADCHVLRRPFDRFAILSEVYGAIRQAELLAVIAGSARLDEITHLYNRRYFLQRLGEEISLSKRHLSPLCCVVLGVNFYQMYLDSYGYAFINALFAYLAEKVSDSIRYEDVAARISDDEIAILLPRSTEKGARVFTNRLVQEINAHRFRYGGYDEEVSVSAGLVGFPLPDNHDIDADTLIRYGRHALHQARCHPSGEQALQLFSEIKPAL